MAVTYRCPKCSQRLRVADESAGMMAACPCGAVVKVPARPVLSPPSSAAEPSLFDELTDSDMARSAQLSPSPIVPERPRQVRPRKVRRKRQNWGTGLRLLLSSLIALGTWVLVGVFISLLLPLMGESLAYGPLGAAASLGGLLIAIMAGVAFYNRGEKQ